MLHRASTFIVLGTAKPPLCLIKTFYRLPQVIHICRRDGLIYIFLFVHSTALNNTAGSVISTCSELNSLTPVNVFFLLTCDGEGSIAWSNRSVGVASHTPIDSSVAFFPAVDNSEEEQIASRKHDTMVAVTTLVATGTDDKVAVSVPFNDWRRRSINWALESYWIVFCHCHIGRMFRNSQSTNTCWKKETKKLKKQTIIAHVYQVSVWILLDPIEYLFKSCVFPLKNKMFS